MIDTIFEDQFRFIQDNGILLAMVGMLTAVPKTPLYERLEKAGRLRLDDPNCNIVPEQMTPLNCSKVTGNCSNGCTIPKPSSTGISKSMNIPILSASGQRSVYGPMKVRRFRLCLYGLFLLWRLLLLSSKSGA